VRACLASDGNTSQGVMVLSGNGNFITFALTTDGTSIGLSARMVAGGVATKVLDDTDFSQYQNPMYLRVTKAGSAFVALYSLDGTNWTQAASFTAVTKFTSIGAWRWRIRCGWRRHRVQARPWQEYTGEPRHNRQHRSHRRGIGMRRGGRSFTSRDKACHCTSP
jgi:hypothetical protein